MLEKIKGGLFGFAVGDAIGASTEFMSKSEIQKEYGKVTDIMGGGWLNLTAGEVTDDTAMSLSVANGIIRDKKNPLPEIGEEFLKWFATNPPDVGITIRTVLSLYKGDWFESAYQAHIKLSGQSAGNGSLMRCLPITFVYSDVKQMEEITFLQSKMTHYDNKAGDACIIYNRIASRLLSGESLKTSIEREISNTIYEPILRKNPNCNPDGYVVHTMNWVLHLLLRYDSFEDVVIEATNMGGDSDTIAAIAGGLKGIEVGYSNLPSRFTSKILCADTLKDISTKLLNIRFV